MKTPATILAQFPAIVTTVLVASAVFQARAQTLPADDLVAISPAQAASLCGLGRLWRLSSWQPESPPPPLPPIVLFQVLGLTEDGSGASSITNYAIYYSQSLGALILDDTQIVAEQMLAEAAMSGNRLMSEDEEETQTGEGYGAGLWLEPVSRDANSFNVLLHGGTNGA